MNCRSVLNIDKASTFSKMANMKTTKTPIHKTQLFGKTMKLVKHAQHNYERMGASYTQNMRNPVSLTRAIIDVLPGSEAPKTKEEIIGLLHEAGYIVNSANSVSVTLNTLKREKLIGSFPCPASYRFGRPIHRYFLHEM